MPCGLVFSIFFFSASILISFQYFCCDLVLTKMMVYKSLYINNGPYLVMSDTEFRMSSDSVHCVYEIWYKLKILIGQTYVKSAMKVA